MAKFSYLRYILGCVVLYNKKELLATQHKHINPPYNQRVKTSTKKKLPMDYNNVNRWYNIGITV
nr:MAG TPA: hypothetical protein [Caudoviricetes sp.]